MKLLQGRGRAIKEIMRCVKSSRNTLCKYTRSTGAPISKKREYERILGSFDSEVMGVFSRGYIGTWIHDELLNSGPRGSPSTVHKYISKVKEGQEISQEGYRLIGGRSR